jgi:CubicO group peptidase (beta-lactamase class C family)
MGKRYFSAAALANITAVMTRHVENGSMPGLGYVVAHGTDAHLATIGTLAFDDPAPMRVTSIARIASLSKPIVAVAAMMLIEDEYLSLHTPVEQFLPELAERRVLRSLDSAITDTVPASRSITLHDLLSFRLGFGCIMAPPGTYPIQGAEASAGLMTLTHQRPVARPARRAAPHAPAGRRVEVQHRRPGARGAAGTCRRQAT